MNAAVNIPVSTVMRVMPENVTALWDQTEPLLAVELERTGTHTTEDVRRLLMIGGAHLWIQFGDHVEAFAITEFVSYPRGLALRMWLAVATAPDRMKLREFREVVGTFARHHHCKWIEACGRHGWMKVFPEAEYTGMLMRVVP